MSEPHPRPLSPHLGIWKPGPHMFISIIHRITGDGMAFVGAAAFIWWLVSAATGKASYDYFMSWANSPYGIFVFIGLTWSFFQHLCSGLRHFVLDTGAGYELDTNRTWSIIAMLTSVVLTAALWVYILLVRG